MYAARPPEPDSTRPESQGGPRRVALASAPDGGGDQGRVTLMLDAQRAVAAARFRIPALRGFERFLIGRPFVEVPITVQRLCGICPVSHHLAAAKAMDRIAGYDRLTPTAEKLRRLLHYGQIVQSHAVHFYHLAGPDLLLGFEGEANRRALERVSDAFPDIATHGVLVRRFGQEVVRAVIGKRGSDGGAVPGGMSRPLIPMQREMLRADVDQVIDWSLDALRMIDRLHATNPAFYTGFAVAEAPMVGLVAASGAADFYHGGLRARAAGGGMLFDHFAMDDLDEVIGETALSGHLASSPYLKQIGPEEGWFRVGPLARVQLCDLLTSEKAETERQRLLAVGEGRGLHGALFQHWARLVELLHAAEVVRELLADRSLCGSDLMAERGSPREQGTGVIEAPRGTLLHHYAVDEAGRVVHCRLCVPTSAGQRAMEAAICAVARADPGGGALSEALLGRIELAIRAHDPCLSCATHALGQMPLEVELIDAGGRRVSAIRRGAGGEVSCAIPV